MHISCLTIPGGYLLSTTRNLLVTYVPLFVRRTQNSPDRDRDRRGNCNIPHALFAAGYRGESFHLRQIDLEAFPEKKIQNHRHRSAPFVPAGSAWSLSIAGGFQSKGRLVSSRSPCVSFNGITKKSGNDTGASAGEETQRSLASHGLPNWNFWEDLMSNI